MTVKFPIEIGESGTLKGQHRNQLNVKGVHKVFRKQPLESLTPRLLGPFSPIKLEKHQFFYFSFTLRISSSFDLMVSTCVSDKEKGDSFSEEIAE